MLHRHQKGMSQSAAEAAAAIGEGLQSFCIRVLLQIREKLVLDMVTLENASEEIQCFAFLLDMSHSQQLRARSVSLRKQTKFVKKPLRVILNGLGKDAATDHLPVSTALLTLRQKILHTGELKEVFRKCILQWRGRVRKVNCYGR